MPNPTTPTLTALVLGAAMLAPAASRAAHVYAGLIDTNGTPGLQTGDALSFVVNSGVAAGQVVTGPSMGIQSMSLVTIGEQAGLFSTSNISYTGLSNGRHWTGAAYRPANMFAATSGSFLQLQIVAVTGPAGAEFSFWDEGVSLTEPAVTYTVGAGVTAGTGIWNLTDLSLTIGDGTNDGIGEPPTGVNNPAVDPYGHIHGRNMTADQEGTYTVSYIIHDAAGNHPDSQPFVVTYDAVPEPASLAAFALGAGLISFVRRRRT